MKILSLHLRHFIDYALVRGISAERFADINFDSETMDEASFYRALEIVNESLNDPLLGVKAGNFLTLKLLGIIYQISLQSTTMEEAFNYLQSYLTATMPIVMAETQVAGQSAVVHLRIENEHTVINRIILENVMTIISREVKMMAGNEVAVQIGSPFFQSSYPANWIYSPDFFISFEAVILKAAFKDRAQLHLDVLVPEYLKMIDQLAGTETFASKVKITMLSMSDPMLPDISAISNALNLTPRTLQRKLVKEEVTFRVITEGLKKQICSFLMLHDPYSVASLSYILGYSEPASFIHSFKKWYGDSPQKVRSRNKLTQHLDPD